ncbi:cation transporter [Deinococcus sonorensis]|uniref:Cation transporter n=1 Tax=Deinococcus sonorensis TaxID=309891 RepID=A0ABV8Y3P4_9DEIO
MPKTIGAGGQSMTCARCVGRVERGLKKVDGDLNAGVNLATERATVRELPGSVSPIIRDAGYEVLEEPAGLSRNDQQREAREREVTHLRGQVVFSAVFALPLLLLAMVPMLIPRVENLPMMTFGHDVTRTLNRVMLALAQPTQFGSGRRFSRLGWKSLKNASPEMNTLAMGIDMVLAEVLPSGKSDAAKPLQAQGERVAFVETASTTRLRSLRRTWAGPAPRERAWTWRRRT